MGGSYLSNGQPDEAITSLETAQHLVEKPSHYIVDRLIRAYNVAERPDKAIEVFEQAPSFIRNRAYVLRDVAEVYLTKENWPKAEQTLHLAIEKEYNNHFAHYNLGIVCQHQQKWLQAAKAFMEAINIRQKRYKVPYPQAEQALEKLLAEHPEAERKSIVTPWPTSKSGRPVGKVKIYHSERGFGFLSVPDSQQDIFFHISQVQGRDEVKVGDYLEYTLDQGKKGPQATNLQALS